MNVRRVPRGYAMLLVVLVLMILALSMGTLVWHLSANIAETRRVITTIRASAGGASTLDAAGRVITATFQTNPSADPEELLAAICNVPNANCADTTAEGAVLPRHLAPPGVEMIDFKIMTIRQRSPTTRRIDAGPFINRLAVEEAILVVAAVQDEKTGRRAVHTDRFIVPSIPITNFPLFATASLTTWVPPSTIRRQNDGAPSRIHVNGSTLDAIDFVPPPPQVSTDQQHINLATSTKGTDQVLRPRVAAPAMSAKQAGLPHSFHWLIDPPTSADTDTQRQARLSVQADLVIIDGVWYLNVDKTAPWPGKPIFSEHGGSTFGIPAPSDTIVEATADVGVGDLGFTAGEFPKLYSWYDRPSDLDPIRAQGSDGGVISYGPLAVQTTSTTCTVDADCSTGQECFRATSGTGVCITMEPATWSGSNLCSTAGFQKVSSCGDEDNALLDGTRSGFRDNEKRILPINFNVREFTRALNSVDPNELGAIIGNRFNGIVYITSRFKTGDYPTNSVHAASDSSLPASLCFKDSATLAFRTCPGNAGNNESSVFSAFSQYVIPVGLCTAATGPNLTGGAGSNPFVKQDCPNASRPNAVRVYGAGVVDPATFPRGLTIVTDLPMYMYGDMNRVQANKPHMKVALVADRITFHSRGWRDKEHPWFDASADEKTALGIGTPTATGVMVLETSLITGAPLRIGSVHDVGDVFRTGQTWAQNFFIMRGHVVMGYNSEWFRDIGNNDDQDDDETDDDDEDPDEGNDVRTVSGGLRWLPDYHLDNPAFQPPGMPLVSLPPTSRYRQQF